VSTPLSERAALLAALSGRLRQISAESVLFSQAVADRLGISPTDLECLDVIQRHGPLTAKELAALTQLTSGAITGVVDRLERAGYARRLPNPSDRRSILIALAPEAAERHIAPLFAPMDEAMTELYARYSDAELAVIADFAAGGVAATRAAIARLRALPSDEVASR
jgi:DNA-binding MarR family transcriptional regulator